MTQGLHLRRPVWALWRLVLAHHLRTGSLHLVLLALSLAIGATTALRFSQQYIQYTVAQQSAQLLAADLVISDTEPVESQWSDAADAHGLSRSEVLQFNSMTMANEAFVLVNVKAVDDAFPLRGELTITGPQGRIVPALGPQEIWLSPILFDLLGVTWGDEVQLADGRFMVSGRIDRDPNQATGFAGLSPTVMIRYDEVAMTNAIHVGSRLNYQLLMAGEPAQLASFLDAYEATLISDALNGEVQPEGTSNLRPLKASDESSRLIVAVQHLADFMPLVNLLTLLLCGLAIALAARHYLNQQRDAIAMIRCLGASQGQLLIAALLTLLLTGLLASLLGLSFGLLIAYALLSIVAQHLSHIDWHLSLLQVLQHLLDGPLTVAIGTSFLLLLGFLLPALWQLSQSPPNHVLRPTPTPPQPWRFLLSGAALCLAVLATQFGPDRWLGLSALLVISSIALIVYGLIVATLYILKKRLPAWAPFVRRPSTTGLQITALALGLSFLAVLFFARDDLLNTWHTQLLDGTPNHFVFGLPPYERDAFEVELKAHGWYTSELYPFVRGRLVAKNNQPFTPELIARNNTLQRDLNLTQSNHFPDNNEVVAGLPEFTGPHQLSVELDTAIDLELSLGDRLHFELPDGAYEVEVVSLRTVQWQSFSPNFFFNFSEGTLPQATASYLGSFYVPPEQALQLSELVRQYPTTVFIDIEAVLSQVVEIVAIISHLITYLAMLVLVAGCIVLLSSLNLMMEERRQEVALLRVIGASQRQIKRQLSREMAIIGATAGLVATVLAEMMAGVAAGYFEMPWLPHWPYWLILTPAMATLSAVMGRYRLRRLWRASPLMMLGR